MNRIALIGWLFVLLVGISGLQAASLLPALPKAKAKANAEYDCVEPVAEMRRNHMEKMLHQRDDTTRRGVRTKQHSLAQCINCHVSADANGIFPRHDSPKHFCGACHQFAGVMIDCFECHSTKPKGSIAMHPLNAKTAHLKHKLAASTKTTVSAEEMAGVAK